MSTVKRDKSPKGDGQSPQFRMRISPELKEQFEIAAKQSNTSLANWLKTLGRKELERLGIEPKG
ncbi:toxin-antitoxin system HicB family antitoxin [Providencia alcalifaciens]|uniref:toxin-antitoxin system HicB family antitoxin n=1 Tax=Providencia TaxID=586 RepID=UPI0023490F63|nr:toxin-antitoxin system HicB family antitoxin [Providencia sp. PROV273]